MIVAAVVLTNARVTWPMGETLATSVAMKNCGVATWSYPSRREHGADTAGGCFPIGAGGFVAGAARERVVTRGGRGWDRTARSCALLAPLRFVWSAR